MADVGEPPAGAEILRASSVATVAVAVSSVVAMGLPRAGGMAHAVLGGALFMAGTVAMGWAFALGVGRSRAEAVDTAGLFLLVGPVAPPEVRRRFRVHLAVQTAAVVAAAAVRPFTVVAFGILAPMFALGLMGLWGARHGAFPPRPEHPVARRAGDDGRECSDG